MLNAQLQLVSADQIPLVKSSVSREFDPIMIESTFVHLPGIGDETEARLWAAGCRTWNDLDDRLGDLFGRAKAEKLRVALEESRAAYGALELAYFHQRLKGGETWRLASDLIARERTDGIAYLDIETTGLGFPPQSHTTTIAVLWNGELLVEHRPEAKRALVERLDREAHLLVTFNGTTFDLPFLRREYGVALAQGHLDLRYWFKRFGHAGGLKAIQTRFPEVHQRASMDIDGFDAVRLWSLHRRGVPNALETLMTYNAEDTIVLEQLMYLGFAFEDRLRPHLGLKTPALPRPTPIATEVCEIVYRILRGGNGY